ncbi:NADH-quinone oxidoreductase subunit L [Nonomuraea sp. NEAU-A123]|uniref:NADH-quinone oxidoreductase subunit 5 family protein n=1 Tax=Nonomuraea sp. NEAU-A123 TaxID=2839649 RepID=UPI001BE498DD|nr:proton-conducting transporter membrane subunit [Nonomuraea sp. NEAU-A123]MBT2226883.1 NADH-quinone oxidoreductase subunit L [Nonomuraea sp. NEAU-A123]
MNALLWLLPALPITMGAVLLLVRRAARSAAVTTAVATLGLAVYAAVARPRAGARLLFDSGLAVDGLSAAMVVTVAGVALAVLVFAAGELREARFFGLMLIFVGAMLLTVTATDLVLLLMGWEVMGAMSYALIGYWWHDGERVRSATIAFVTTRAGDLGLYFAAGAAFAGALAATGNGNGAFALAVLSGDPAPWRDLIAAGIVVAALGKSAQVPFSFWLSRAMAGPSPVSALLHSATMVAAGAYLLLRVQPLLAATGWAAAVVAWAGAVTALLLGAVAVAQRDLKQLLAASTCTQIGFMVLGAGVGAVPGGAAQLVAHAAVKSLLFLGAGAWLAALGTKDLTGLHGAARRYPLVGVTFGIGALALAGVPPLSLWLTKDAVLGAVREPVLYGVAFAGALLGAAYAAKALVAVWRPVDAGTRDDTEQPGTRRVGVLERLPLPVLALGAVVLGLPVLAGDGWHLTAGELALSGTLAAAVVLAVAFATRNRWDAVPGEAVRRAVAMPGPRGLLAGWLWLEKAAVALVWRPLTAVAGGAAWFDDRVVDGAVNAVPRLGMAAARLARRPFESGIDGAVRAVAGAAGRLGTLARRPQTGQVHLYFAQAAVALIVLAVVFVLAR